MEISDNKYFTDIGLEHAKMKNEPWHVMGTDTTSLLRNGIVFQNSFYIFVLLIIMTICMFDTHY